MNWKKEKLKSKRLQVLEAKLQQLVCERCKEEITRENFWTHGIVNGIKTKHYRVAYT